MLDTNIIGYVAKINMISNFEILENTHRFCFENHFSIHVLEPLIYLN